MHDGQMNGDKIGASAPDDLSVRNNTAIHRFEAVTPDGEVAGYLAYDVVPTHVPTGRGAFVAVHTIVEPDHGGAGVGTMLARVALDHARAEHLVVIPECSFVRAFVERHAEYQDLLP